MRASVVEGTTSNRANGQGRRGARAEQLGRRGLPCTPCAEPARPSSKARAIHSYWPAARQSSASQSARQQCGPAAASCLGCCSQKREGGHRQRKGELLHAGNSGKLAPHCNRGVQQQRCNSPPSPARQEKKGAGRSSQAVPRHLEVVALCKAAALHRQLSLAAQAGGQGSLDSS